MSQELTTTGRRGFLKQSAFAVAAEQRAGTADAGGGPIAETQDGKVRGVEQNGVQRFLGIRYGADTGGTNRFQPPAGGIDYTLSVQWHAWRERESCVQAYRAAYSVENDPDGELKKLVGAIS